LLLVSSPAMTNQIDQPEAAGLVDRSPHPDDRRVVRVGLTDALLAHAADARQMADHRPLTDDEQATQGALLRKLLRHLEGSAVRSDHPPPRFSEV
jgi:DNA-binding MarR family transcriptional regulator